MKRQFSLFALVVLAGALVRGAADDGLRASKPEVRKEVIAVIEVQLAAFRAADYAKAYGCAAAEFRARNSLQGFVGIVRAGYPEIWFNSRAECGVVRDNGTWAKLLVHVYGHDSNATYDYTLVKERGGWRIRDVLRHAPKKSDKV